MKDFIKKNKKVLIFVVPIILGLLVSICYVLLNHGNVWENFFFRDKNDGFMDFYNSVSLSLSGKVYENYGIYPPLIYYMYIIFGHMMPSSVLHGNVYDMSSSYEGQIVYLFYILMCVFLAIYSIDKLNKSNKLNSLIISSFILSFPVIYCFQRGNAIILACIFSILYFAFYDSDNKFLRHLSLISLAISANIKLYPALFGLLLIKDKRYKDAIICVIYGVVLFVLPFLSFGGFDSIKYYIRNLIGTGEVNRMCKTYLISLDTTLIQILHVLKINISSNIISKLTYLLIPFSYIPFMNSNKRWKNILLITLIFILIPHLSYSYVLMFLFIPAILIINDKESNKIDYVYLIIISLLLSTIGFIPEIYNHDFFILFEKVLLLILLMIELVDGYIAFYKSKIKKNGAKS